MIIGYIMVNSYKWFHSNNHAWFKKRKIKFPEIFYKTCFNAFYCPDCFWVLMDNRLRSVLYFVFRSVRAVPICQGTSRFDHCQENRQWSKPCSVFDYIWNNLIKYLCIISFCFSILRTCDFLSFKIRSVFVAYVS